MKTLKILISSFALVAFNAFADGDITVNRVVEKVGLVKVQICGAGNVCKLVNIFLQADENKITDLKIEGKAGDTEVKISNSKLKLKNGTLEYDGKEVSASSTSGKFEIKAQEGKSGIIIKFKEKKGLFGFNQLNEINENQLGSDNLKDSSIVNKNRNGIDAKIPETDSLANTREGRFGHTI